MGSPQTKDEEERRRMLNSCPPAFKKLELEREKIRQHIEKAKKVLETSQQQEEVPLSNGVISPIVIPSPALPSAPSTPFSAPSTPVSHPYYGEGYYLDPRSPLSPIMTPSPAPSSAPSTPFSVPSTPGTHPNYGGHFDPQSPLTSPFTPSFYSSLPPSPMINPSDSQIPDNTRSTQNLPSEGQRKENKDKEVEEVEKKDGETFKEIDYDIMKQLVLGVPEKAILQNFNSKGFTASDFLISSASVLRDLDSEELTSLDLSDKEAKDYLVTEEQIRVREIVRAIQAKKEKQREEAAKETSRPPDLKPLADPAEEQWEDANWTASILSGGYW